MFALGGHTILFWGMTPSLGRLVFDGARCLIVMWLGLMQKETLGMHMTLIGVIYGL